LTHMRGIHDSSVRDKAASYFSILVNFRQWISKLQLLSLSFINLNSALIHDKCIKYLDIDKNCSTKCSIKTRIIDSKAPEVGLLMVGVIDKYEHFEVLINCDD